MPPDAPSAAPDQVLERLHELSADVRLALVLDAAGEIAAATERDRAAAAVKIARELLDQADRANAGEPVAQLEVSSGYGAVYGVRENGLTVIAIADRDSLPSLMFFDIHEAIGRA